MKIGFIGLGNMGSALIGGMLSKKVAAKENIMGADCFLPAVEGAEQKLGIHTTADNRAVAAFADILVLSVKPQMMSEVIGQIKEAVSPDTVIVSIAAGKTIAWLENEFDKAVKLVRAMPNTPALVGEGISGLCRNGNITDEDMLNCMKLMESFGLAEEVPESLMDAIVSVSASSPAYVFMFIEAMADGAVAAGMPRNQAYRFAAQSVLGSARMVLETGKHPGELKDMVCSPGGTTIEAVKVLEEKGLRGAVLAAMEACVNKSKNM